jgi:hypothetical protein
LNQPEFGIYLSALRGYTLMAEDAQRRGARRQGGGNKPRRLKGRLIRAAKRDYKRVQVEIALVRRAIK